LENVERERSSFGGGQTCCLRHEFLGKSTAQNSRQSTARKGLYSTDFGEAVQQKKGMEIEEAILQISEAELARISRLPYNSFDTEIETAGIGTNF
jgi:hypothetical protein